MALITKALDETTKAAREGAQRLALPVIGLGAVFAILYYGRVFFITSLVAVIIAFILEPIVALLIRLRLPRSVASFVVCTLALLFLYIVGMGAYSQLSGLYQDLPRYGQRIGDIVDGVRLKLQSVEENTYRMLLPARQRRLDEERQKQAQNSAGKKRGKKGEPTAAAAAPPPAAAPAPPQPEGTPLADYVYSRLRDFYQIVLMASFVPFLVYFMLSWRDHINRSFLQFFHGEDRLVAARSLAGIAEMVRAFVVGNFLLGILLAFLSSMAFWVIRLPYPLLVGPLSGFLSLVPYVGLPLAVLPPLFAALGVNQVPIYVLVIIIASVLHLLALNLFYPKIVGSRVHLNPLVVTFSLMLWGFLWDAPGLLLAIPLTAGLKAVCDNVKDLRPFGKFLGD
ncbi:MAG: AI-2E family transporter [Acidobacteriia bacterium]|nr:AI-2E family transporter [Terriglobia bacterium]